MRGERHHSQVVCNLLVYLSSVVFADRCHLHEHQRLLQPAEQNRDILPSTSTLLSRNSANIRKQRLAIVRPTGKSRFIDMRIAHVYASAAGHHPAFLPKRSSPLLHMATTARGDPCIRLATGALPFCITIPRVSSVTCTPRPPRANSRSSAKRPLSLATRTASIHRDGDMILLQPPTTANTA